MKVLYVIDSLRMGGAENLLPSLARVAPARGFRFEVVSLTAEPHTQAMLIGRLQAAGVRTTTLPVRGLGDPRAIPMLVAAIRASGSDLVHAHLEYATALTPAAARLARRPSVCTLHHVPVADRGLEAIKERFAVSSGTHSGSLIFVSVAALWGFAQRYGGIRRTWTVIRNGIDLDGFIPGDGSIPADLPIPPDAQFAVLVGSMRGHKGHADALRAWPVVLNRVPDARLLFVGAGPEEPALRALATQLGVSEHVVFVGPRIDVAPIMRASSLVLLPSKMEALPTVLMEAAACGRPVVATRVGGTPEVVHDGETGHLVPPGDISHLASSIVELLSDTRRSRYMGRAARLLAEERFDVTAWCDRLTSLYDRVLAGRRRVDPRAPIGLDRAW